MRRVRVLHTAATSNCALRAELHRELEERDQVRTLEYIEGFACLDFELCEYVLQASNMRLTLREELATIS